MNDITGTYQIGWYIKSYNNNSGVDKTANVWVNSYYIIVAGGFNASLTLYRGSSV